MKVEKVLIVSTSHISRPFHDYLEDEAMMAKRLRMGVHSYQFGWLFFIPAEDEDSFENPNFQRQYSELIDLGRTLEVDFIVLDGEAECHPDLEVYDW